MSRSRADESQTVLENGHSPCRLTCDDDSLPGDIGARLDQHRRWLDSGGAEGMRLHLSGFDGQGLNLEAARFDQAELIGANFSRAYLQGATFKGAVLRDCRFIGADLRGVDLRDGQGLNVAALANADLAGAMLPDLLGEFEGLNQLSRIASHARTIFLSLVAACAYCVLTVGTTLDADLIVDRASTPLPIIETEVPIAAFYWVAPVVLLLALLWLHVYAQRIWSELADLPAVLPDGKRLSERVEPWVPISLAFGTFRKRAASRRTYRQLERGLSVLALWLMVPATIILLWYRYLVSHEPVGSALQAVVVAMAAAAGLAFFLRCRRTVRLGAVCSSYRRSEAGWTLATFLGLAALFLLASDGAIHGGDTKSQKVLPLHRKWVPRIAESVGLRTNPNLVGAALSLPPPGWNVSAGGAQLAEQLVGAIPANLPSRNLEGARAEGAFLARADLSNASLRSAVLVQAQLVQANLFGADLSGAALQFADLRDADLSAASLDSADLANANLQGACLNGSDLSDAYLRDADLSGADLSLAFNLSSDSLALAVCDARTQLPAGLETGMCQGVPRAPVYDGSGTDLSPAHSDTSFVPPTCQS